jgi:hypothetical protein
MENCELVIFSTWFIGVVFTYGYFHSPLTSIKTSKIICEYINTNQQKAGKMYLYTVSFLFNSQIDFNIKMQWNIDLTKILQWHFVKQLQHKKMWADFLFTMNTCLDLSTDFFSTFVYLSLCKTRLVRTIFKIALRAGSGLKKISYLLLI